MRRYLITDRRQAGGVDGLLRAIEKAHADLIQVREKDLTARELLDLTRKVLGVRGHSPVLVNGRADVAKAAGAQGVHLPSNSISAARLRAFEPGLIGVSCHSLEEARRAASEGADLLVFGPVYASPGKGPPAGLDALREVCRAVRIPVYALGGVNEENAAACVAAGATGIAGIRLFLP